MSQYIYAADRSATRDGWVGLVIDSTTQRVISRTPYVYANSQLATVAAKRAHEAQAVEPGVEA